jgi:transposase
MNLSSYRRELFSYFCELYQKWAKKLDIALRQRHNAGEKLFIDYAGHTVPVRDPETGKITDAQIFIAVLGASNYTFAGARAPGRAPGDGLRDVHK